MHCHAMLRTPAAVLWMLNTKTWMAAWRSKAVEGGHGWAHAIARCCWRWPLAGRQLPRGDGCLCQQSHLSRLYGAFALLNGCTNYTAHAN